MGSDEDHDLPPGTSIVSKATRIKRKSNQTTAPNKGINDDDDDDTPKSFKRLMQQMQRRPKNRPTNTADMVKSRPTLKIHSSESLKEFNERVNMTMMKDMAVAADFGSRRKEKIRQRNRRLQDEKRRRREEEQAEKRWISKDTSVPVNIQEVAQAPPENITVPRKVLAASGQKKTSAGKKRPVTLSLAAQKILSEERQRAIDIYRSMKNKKNDQQ